MSLGVWCSPSVIVHIYISPSSGHSRISFRCIVTTCEGSKHSTIHQAVRSAFQAASSFKGVCARSGCTQITWLLFTFIHLACVQLTRQSDPHSRQHLPLKGCVHAAVARRSHGCGWQSTDPPSLTHTQMEQGSSGCRNRSPSWKRPPWEAHWYLLPERNLQRDLENVPLCRLY